MQLSYGFTANVSARPSLADIVRFALVALVTAIALAAPCNAHAHPVPGSTDAAPIRLDDGTLIALSGRLSVLDVVGLGGATERIYALTSDDGRSVRVKFASGATAIDNGAQLTVSGQMSRGALLVEQFQRAASAKAASQGVAASVEGRLQLLHADNFDGGVSQFMWRVQDDAGARTTVRFAIAPEILVPGMRVRVTGTSDGSAIAASSIAIVAAAPSQVTGPAATSAQAINVLVILVKFSNSPAIDPFTQAQAQTTMTGSSGIGPFWNETSFGNVAMTGTATPWLTWNHPTPDWCDANTANPQSAYDLIETNGLQLAQSAGYTLANYQKFVFVFARISACGWAGLGEVGGQHAWSNQYNTLAVIGHEIGHTLGLGHANSLPCSGKVISTTCALSRPEYGDPFGIMGNQRPMHVSAWQKNYLGWVPDAKVATWTGGTQTFVLSPLEQAGGTTYAVQVPAAYKRTYWVEFRQPIGFDAGLSSFNAPNGATVHLNGLMHQSDRSEYGCWDNCYLDMTPATASMTDGALVAPGPSYPDSYTGITLTAVSKTGTMASALLTVTVAGPPTQKQFAIYRPSVGKFLIDYGFDHSPDTRLPFGAAGDVPLSGRLSSAGLSAVGVYRHGLWYFDTNLDGKSDRAVAFGGGATDKPLLADFNNDGQDDLVIYRDGVWYVDQFLNGTVDKTFYFGGGPNDVPLAADVNGDGIADLVIYRNGVWYIDTNRNGTADIAVNFGGMAQDRPYLFDWDGDGKADLVIYRDGMWYVNTHLDGTAQAVFGYGTTNDVPFAGRFY